MTIRENIGFTNLMIESIAKLGQLHRLAADLLGWANYVWLQEAARIIIV
jgi:hypothetical protein